MKQKRYTDKQRSQARPVLSAESCRLAIGQELSPQRAGDQRYPAGAVGAPHTQATAVSAAAIARAVQPSSPYFIHTLSRWSAMWSESFYDLIAVVERFRSIPSLAALDVSISRQLNLETNGASRSLEGR